MIHGVDSNYAIVESISQKRWSIAFAAALMNALQSGGFFFTPTTLMPLIVADFGLPLSLSTVPIAVGKVAYVLLLIPGGMMVDHFGPRICVLVGIFGLAFMLTLYSMFVSSFWMMLMTHVLLATVACVSGVPVYSIFIAQWFEGGLGLAMGLVLAGYSAAGTAVPAMLGPVATAFGWRVAMCCKCGLLWFVGLPVTYFFLHEYGPSAVSTQSEVQDDISSIAAEEGETTPLLRDGERAEESFGLPDAGMADQKSWTFVGIAFSYILLQYCFGCLGENIMFFLTIDRGMSLGLASLFFSALNLSAFAAKLVGGHLGDRFDRFHVASASSGLAAVGIIFLFLGTPGLDEHNIPYLASHPLAILMFTVLFGFGYGATFNCLYALTPIIFGKLNLGRTQSTLFGLGLAGNAAGSVLTGVLRSSYETYQRPFLIAAVACIANFFVFNVTRVTLGGSLEGLNSLNAAEQEQLAMSGTFHGMDELEAAEEAARQRIAAYSSAGTSPRMSPTGSILNMRKTSDFLGAAFVPVPSADGAGIPSSQSIYRALGSDIPETPISASSSFVGISRSGSRHSGTGMQIERGYPIVRDWSSSSLRARLARTTSTESNGASPRPLRPLKKSSTMEAMIESGILSASLEAVGYLGVSPRPSGPQRIPLSSSLPSGGALALEKPSTQIPHLPRPRLDQPADSPRSEHS